MLGRFSTVIQSAVDALAPPVSLLDDFTYHWKMIMKFYVKRNSVLKISIENTNIPGHLDQLLRILLEEESKQEAGVAGPCLEYMLEHKLLDLLVTLASSDCPPGMKQYTLETIRKIITQIKHPIMPHVSVYNPLMRLISSCNGKQPSPTEYHEICFLLSLCAIMANQPNLMNVFSNKTNKESSIVYDYSDSSGFSSENKSNHKKEDNNLTPAHSSNTTEKISTLDIDETCSKSDVLELHTRTNSEFDALSTTSSMSTGDLEIQFKNAKIDSKGNSLDELTLNDKPHNTFVLLDALLSYINSADSRVMVKACEGLMVIASLPSDTLAKAIVNQSSLCMVLSSKLVSNYLAIPAQIDPNDIDEMQIHWGHDSPLWSSDNIYPGCRQLAMFISWLDYCDQLIKESHPSIGSALALNIRLKFFEGILAPALMQSEAGDKVLITAFITKCLKQITAPSLLTEYIYWLVGESREPELPGIPTCPIRQQLLDNCFHELDEVCLETLRLFEVLIEKPHEHILHCLVLTYLNRRNYYDSENSNIERVSSWSDEEDEREKQAASFLDITDGPASLSLTLAPANIQKVINSFLELVPHNLRTSESGSNNEEEELTGYSQYIRDGDRLYRACLARCSAYGWPHEATWPEDSISETNKSEFYEGPFLEMIFSRLLRLPYQPYEINLQLTGLISRLAMLPHPYLHEFLLNPLVPLTSSVNSLYTVLQMISTELATYVPVNPDYRAILHETRLRLLGDTNESQEENNCMFESLIVLEEFCKELAAIAFVKYHHSS